jgi:hypothetical protein
MYSCTDDNRLYEWREQQIYGKIWLLITNGMACLLLCIKDVESFFFVISLISENCVS